MFPVKTTQQTLPPEVSTPLPDSYFPRSSYQLISTDSLLTLPSCTHPLKSVSLEKAGTLPLPPTALTDFSRAIIPFNSTFPTPMSTNSIFSSASSLAHSISHFSAIFPSQDTSLIRTPHKYPTNLTPRVSELHPHCAARDCLRLWKPTFSRSPDDQRVEITDSDLDRLITVINTSWQPTTRETYGAGLLVYHVFCDLRLIPEDSRCPADSLLMLTFISSCAGSY